MSAPDLAVAESPRARQGTEEEPESEPPRKWVALVSVIDLPGNEDDERAQAIVPGTDVLLDVNDPPLPSYLVLHPRVAPNPRRNNEPLSAYILAADRSGCILLQVMEGNIPDFFLCNTHSCNVTIIPPVSSYIEASKGLDIVPILSIGLLADLRHRGDYVVAQLHQTTSNDNPVGVLCYSSAKGRWFTRNLTVQQDSMPNPFSETGVLAHDGRLWWIALAYGVFFCDPFTLQPPELRFLPLPHDCVMEGDVGFDPRIRTLLDQRRCVRLSEGKLRFVEIRGLSYDVLVDADAPPANPTVWMWTLDDPEGPEPWKPEYEVSFAEIWDNDTYADAGLQPSEVPHVALVHPNNHYVVYFFQGSKLFGVDMREKKVVASQECLIDRDQLVFRSSRPIVDAWEVPPRPPTLPGDRRQPELLFDDLYREILLRLPADRSKLRSRFAAVSTTWHRLLTDPTFLRSYREFHGLPNLIGYVHDGGAADLVFASFITTADTAFCPRVPEKGVDLHVLDSRHGRVIFGKFGKGWFGDSTLIIWDPIADHYQEVPRPKAFRWGEFDYTATILCDLPGCDHFDCHGGPFRVVLVGILFKEGVWATSAYNYTVKSGSWTISPAAAATVADEEDWGFPMPAPSTLVGGSTLYFRSPGRILRYLFGGEMEQLMYVDIPPFNPDEARGTVLMPAADRLSFAAMFGDTIRFWESGVSAEGSVDWVHTQNALTNIPVPGVALVGAAANLLFIRTNDDEIISIDVGTGDFKLLPPPAAKKISGLIPFMSFRTP